jgi:hypothetical protein
MPMRWVQRIAAQDLLSRATWNSRPVMRIKAAQRPQDRSGTATSVSAHAMQGSGSRADAQSHVFMHNIPKFAPWIRSLEAQRRARCGTAASVPPVEYVSSRVAMQCDAYKSEMHLGPLLPSSTSRSRVIREEKQSHRWPNVAPTSVQ